MIEYRRMQKEDFPRIAALEKQLFSDSWSEKVLEDFFASPFSLGYVAEVEGEITCYALASLIAGEGELLRIGCEKTHRRRGFAEGILNRFLAEAKKNGAEKIFLEVREHNPPAARLYEKNGFLLIGRRALYYKNPSEDALIYQKTL